MMVFGLHTFTSLHLPVQSRRKRVFKEHFHPFPSHVLPTKPFKNMSSLNGLAATRADNDSAGSLSIEEGSSTSARPTSYSDPRNSSSASPDRMRIVVVILLVCFLLFIIVDSLRDRHVESTILKFMGWVEQNPHQGMLTVILVYIIATILFVPGSILTFGTGYAFGSAYDSKVEGVLVASTVVFIGASLGSICTFLLGRYLFRSCVVQMASSYPIFQAIDRGTHANLHHRFRFMEARN